MKLVYRYVEDPSTWGYLVADRYAALQRLSQALKEGKEISEVLLNYRRDGSTFMNLLMMVNVPNLARMGQKRASALSHL